MYTTVGALCLKGRPILQQMELLGKTIGAIILFQGLLLTKHSFYGLYTSVLHGTVNLS